MSILFDEKERESENDNGNGVGWGPIVGTNMLLVRGISEKIWNADRIEKNRALAIKNTVINQ